MIKALLFDFAQVLLFLKEETSVDALIEQRLEMLKQPNYRLYDHFVLNTELLEYLSSLKDRYPIYLFSSDSIHDAPELSNIIEEIFSKVYSAKKMGVSKKEAEAYAKIAGDLNLLPEEILFVDDSEENLKAARTAGLYGVHYENNSKLYQQLIDQLPF